MPTPFRRPVFSCMCAAFPCYSASFFSLLLSSAATVANLSPWRTVLRSWRPIPYLPHALPLRRALFCGVVFYDRDVFSSRRISRRCPPPPPPNQHSSPSARFSFFCALGALVSPYRRRSRDVVTGRRLRVQVEPCLTLQIDEPCTEGHATNVRARCASCISLFLLRLAPSTVSTTPVLATSQCSCAPFWARLLTVSADARPAAATHFAQLSSSTPAAPLLDLPVTTADARPAAASPITTNG